MGSKRDITKLTQQVVRQKYKAGNAGHCLELALLQALLKARDKIQGRAASYSCRLQSNQRMKYFIQ